MYICICNAITETQLKENPELKKLIGTKCGKCLPWIEKGLIPGTDIKIKEQ